MPTSSRTEPPGNLDLEWASRELIPFLELVFGEQYGREKRPTSHWVHMVLFARFKLDRIVSILRTVDLTDVLQAHRPLLMYPSGGGGMFGIHRIT